MFQKKGNRQRKIVVIRRLISFLFCLRIGQEETITRPPDLLLGGGRRTWSGAIGSANCPHGSPEAFSLSYAFPESFKMKFFSSFIRFLHFFNEENKFSRMNE